jgi:predicted chitinase
LTPINLAVRKYGLTSPTRLAHFLGQGAVESYSLASMQETSMKGLLDATGMHGKEVNPASKIPESMLGHWYGQISTEDDAWYRNVKFNKNGKRITGSYDWKNGNCDHEDAQKFRGRGFKQLTGRSNYASYWVFRGWISRTSFNPSWWDDPAYIAHDRNGMKKIPAKIDDPQRISFPENCIDCAGFYLRFERPSTIEKIDSDKAETALTNKDKAIEHLISREVTHAINGGYIDADTRLDYTREAKKILT